MARAGVFLVAVAALAASLAAAAAPLGEPARACVVVVAHTGRAEGFKVVQGRGCAQASRTTPFEGNVQTACADICLHDVDCAGFFWNSSVTVERCNIVNHETMALDAVRSGECHQEEGMLLAVRDTRLASAKLDRTVNDVIHVRCPDLTIIANATIRVGSARALSREITQACQGLQSCSLPIAATNVSRALLAECERAGTTDCGIAHVNIECQAAGIFNEDNYFISWSSSHWATARAQAKLRQAMWRRAVNATPAYPVGNFSGRGLVLVAGGKYLESALVLSVRLREMGFKYPIQLWHMGPEEIWASAKPFLKALQVETKDFLDHVPPAALEAIPANVGPRRFQLKPLAILHSNLKEVLLLDADNIPTRNPAFLFDEPKYQESGAVFWPDYWTTDLRNPVWAIMGVAPRMQWEQESGQLLVNKEKSWRALHLCVHLNSEFYMQLLNGDKDTFRFAWLATNTSYYMVETWPAAVGNARGQSAQPMCGHTMLHHGIDGQPLFAHHNQMKDLVLPLGENFKYMQKKAGLGRAVPQRGLSHDDQVIPCLELQTPGIAVIDQVSVTVELSHLDFFELRYATALRNVRAALRPDRVLQRRNSPTPNGATFQVSSDTSELVANCSTSTQTVEAQATATTDRFCATTNLTVDTFTYTVTVGSKTSQNDFYGEGSTQAYFLTDSAGNQEEAPALTVYPSFTYKFVFASSADSTLSLILTTTYGGGNGSVPYTEGVTGAPAVFGDVLTFSPQLNAVGHALEYEAQGAVLVGAGIYVAEASFEQQFTGTSQRFNTAFNPNAQLFQVPAVGSPSLSPTQANITTVLDNCQQTCLTDPTYGLSCEGVYLYTTSSYVLCYGLSDIGVGTTSTLNGQSWQKVAPLSFGATT